MHLFSGGFYIKFTYQYDASMFFFLAVVYGFIMKLSMLNLGDPSDSEVFIRLIRRTRVRRPHNSFMLTKADEERDSVLLSCAQSHAHLCFCFNCQVVMDS
jgi:hypothetical protein